MCHPAGQGTRKALSLTPWLLISQGMHAASDFVHAHFLTRHVDVSSLLSFRHPKHVLAVEVRKLMAEAGAADQAAIETRCVPA